MKKIFFITCFFFCYHLSSQVKITTPKGDIYVKNLNINVEVVGDLAVTTFDMQFYNPNNRDLEGELFFPLKENQYVTRFALDINGHLREAVVVEKEKARVAFESTVRNKIDPAILEIVEGNNYKARVYPILAKSYKRLVLAYSQKLTLNNGNFYYRLPKIFSKKIQEFNFSISITGKKIRPSYERKQLSDFVYNKFKNSYVSNFEKKKYRFDDEIIIKIPVKSGTNLYKSKDFFYLSHKLDIEPISYKPVKKVTLFWDKSYSQINKNLNRELQLLDAFIKRNNNLDITLITFNTTRTLKNYQIKNGNWKSLKNDILNIVYDGVSSYSFLKNYTDSSEINILFTDGISTIDDFVGEIKTITYVINSCLVSNELNLKRLAESSKGKYINILNYTNEQAYTELTTCPILFLGANINLQNTYPVSNSTINKNFELIGKGKLLTKNIKLFFGSNNDTLFEIEPQIKENKLNNNILTKYWASKKIQYLSNKSEIDENEIVKLSKKYNVISKFTSMIILDRVEDYVTHKIKPPAELLDEYNMILSKREDESKEQYLSLKNNLKRQYEELISWYDTNYEEVKVDKKTPELIRPVENNISNEDNQERNLIIQGKVSDDSGELPGVAIHIKGTRIGRETDFDGNYSIRVSLNDILVFSFVGMQTKEVQVVNTNPINVTLEAEDVLEEVVVTAMGISRETVASNENDILGTEKLSAGNKIIIVDGVELSNKPKFKTSEIESFYTLNGTQGKALFGVRGKEGVFVYETTKGREKNKELISLFEEKVSNLELKGWSPDTPYLKEFENLPKKDMYLKYLQIREKYLNTPAFYLDVSDLFFEKGLIEQANTIMSNVLELDVSNYELIKAVAYKFEEQREFVRAIYLYKKVLSLRPEDIQSYRDLAIAYENNNEYQKSFDLFYKIVNGELLDKDKERRFNGVEKIAFLEMNRLITKYSKYIDYNNLSNDLVHDIKLDLRVVIDWNHNDTDIDLWVIDPNGEKCFYKHTNTKIGGLLSDDMVNGYGPEQFILNKSIKGNYNVKVKYYSSNQQKISGPTFLKVTTFKNYGKKDEFKKVKLIRLVKKGDVVDLGNLILN